MSTQVTSAQSTSDSDSYHTPRIRDRVTSIDQFYSAGNAGISARSIPNYKDPET